MQDLFGYAGRLARIDLSERKIDEVTLDQDILKSYIGGAALGARILYDEVPPEINWSDPSNKLIITTGPLGGTTFPGAGTVNFVTKGALTNGAASGQANGVFGAYLKLAGYDGIILQGRCDDLVYLSINENSVNIRGAEELKGLDTYETYSELKGDVEGGRVSVLSIGPAGENLVRFAGIFEREGHSASKNGLGAVMGSKRVKAIAVLNGDKKIKIKHPDEFKEIAEKVRDNASKLTGTIGSVYDLQKSGSGVLPVKNYTTNVWDISDEEIEKWKGERFRDIYNPKPNPCWGCPATHSTIMTIPAGRYKGMKVEEPEYEQLAAWGPQIDNKNPEAAAMLSGLCDRLGLDNNEMGWMAGWLMECYERDLIDKDQLGGLEMTWGNTEAVKKLMQMIAYREGIGDLLAEGIMRASQELGGRAAEAAIYTMKGNAPRGHDHRTRWGELFDTIVSNTGTLENHVSISGLPPYSGIAGNPDKVVEGEALTKGVMILNDSLGNCRFPTGLDLQLFTDLLNTVTGWGFTEEEAKEVGLRAVNLMKVFNLRAGIGREKDAPSQRYGSTHSDGPYKDIGIKSHLDSMLRKYYRLMGWDEKTSKPLPDTLEYLGLEDAIEDIW